VNVLAQLQLAERPAKADLAIPMARPSVGPAELAAVGRVFESNWLGAGPVADRFSMRVAETVGAEHVVAVDSGTAALHSAMNALRLGAGDEVIVPSMTFVSTIQAIVSAGAVPVFCEVLAETMNMDVRDAATRITSKTRALLPVHYGGEPCDLDAVLVLAAKHGLKVIEDAAHAFGSSYKGRPIGSHGDIVCFSFDPIKNITCGLGGAAATNDREIAGRLRIATNVGIDPSSVNHAGAGPQQYAITGAGLRYRMSDVNAVIGLTQLDRMAEFRRQKLGVVERYNQAFADLPQVALLERNLAEIFPFSYVIRVLDGSRDALREFLSTRGIGSAVQFFPNHLQPFFGKFHASLPRTEQLFGEVVNLPLYAGMTDQEVETVIAAVRSFFGRAS
jgi:perosamine synthetase